MNCVNRVEVNRDAEHAGKELYLLSFSIAPLVNEACTGHPALHLLELTSLQAVFSVLEGQESIPR